MGDGIEDIRQNVCPICKLGVQSRGQTSTEKKLKCERCGDYWITSDTLLITGELSDGNRPKLSGWIADQNRSGVVPHITPDVVTDIARRAPLRFSERARRLLIYFVENTSRYGDAIRIWQPPIAARVEIFDETQIRYLAKHRVTSS